MRHITKVIIHCAATKPNMDIVSIKGRKHASLVCEKCSKPFTRQLRVYKKSLHKNKCFTCAHTVDEKKKKRPNRPSVLCNCGKLIWKGSAKCKSCAQTEPRPNCKDCGVVIGLHATRCLPCHNKKQNKGLSKQRALFNNSPDWAKVRDKSFARDKYECQICREPRGHKNAHHIYPYAQYPEHRLNINNLITLCVPCHKFVHNVMGNSR
jgi:5-methylcytosine-specific restriction endonuclease McrA